MRPMQLTTTLASSHRCQWIHLHSGECKSPRIRAIALELLARTPAHLILDVSKMCPPPDCVLRSGRLLLEPFEGPATTGIRHAVGLGGSRGALLV
jgi:hypothetical protein